MSQYQIRILVLISLVLGELWAIADFRALWHERLMPDFPFALPTPVDVFIRIPLLTGLLALSAQWRNMRDYLPERKPSSLSFVVMLGLQFVFFCILLMSCWLYKETRISSWTFACILWVSIAVCFYFSCAAFFSLRLEGIRRLLRKCPFSFLFALLLVAMDFFLRRAYSQEGAF
ncbi:MAG: hypothetical protein HQL32_18145, partial [Planctomycetes bacterium]|nr:hypothetical protein [Planctomycetota bacterium]